MRRGTSAPRANWQGIVEDQGLVFGTPARYRSGQDRPYWDESAAYEFIAAEIVPNLKLWQTLLIGNLLSSFGMTYLTMPRYVNPLFRFWLRPARGASEPRTTLRGVALVVALQLFWAMLFFLVTDLIWKLP